ncbi:MAG: glycosyltransferase family 4 protein [Candidatus Sumerlaeia bacterium]|nr:glycosyltransferase family 4 protein [Candidatus Sumerlaeia bacterium]
MKILIISNLFPPHVLGGYEILCKQVCDALQERGHSIRVLTSDHQIPGSAEAASFPYVVERLLKLAPPFGMPPTAQALRDRGVRIHNQQTTEIVINNKNPDVVFYWSQLRLGMGALRANRPDHIPAAITFNDDNIRGILPRAFTLRPAGLVRWFLDRTWNREETLQGKLGINAATCISACLQEQLVTLNLPFPKPVVIFQGIPVERWPSKQNVGKLGSGTKEDPIRICYAGQLNPYKGVHTLLEALEVLSRRMPGRMMALDIAGDGDPKYKQQLQDLANRLTQVSVRFLGRIPHPELVNVYHEADLFVFPSIWKEPFGLTHLEAMACGTPVVSTTDGGHGEFLRDGVNCLAFPKENAGALADALQRLVEDDALRYKVTKEGQRCAREDFSLGRYVIELEDFLQRTIGRTK